MFIPLYQFKSKPVHHTLSASEGVTYGAL